MAKTYEEELASLDRELAKIKAKRAKVIKKHSENERNARTHALCTVGGLVLSLCYPDGWQSVDLMALASILHKNASIIAAQRAEVLGTAEAKARLDSWRREIEKEYGVSIDR